MPIRNPFLFPSLAALAVVCAVAIAPAGWACEAGQDVCLEVESNDAPQAEPPKPAEPARRDRAAEIKALEDAITADLKARRLTRPPGNNAIWRIEQMQSLSPEHDYAINGRQYVVDIYLSLASWQWRRDNRDAAMRHLATARTLDPGSSAVDRLARQLLDSDSPQPSKDDSSASSDAAPAPKPVTPPTTASNTKAPAKQPMATPGPDSESEPVEPTEVWQQGKDAQFPAMVAIPAGRFEMGGRLPAELPRREVQLPAFSLSRHEVTVAQYRRYALDVGVKMPQIASDRDNMPVTGVNWHDAKGYAAWLAQRTGRAYRLPSEAEWEYAARAGTTTPYFGGTTLQGANCVGCDVEDHAEPKDVGSYQANDFGLFDTHGNVWEWVLDCWRDNYRNARSDGAAYERDNCERRVLRGGSWYNTAEFARSAYRGREVSGFRDGGVGFRVAHDGL